MQIIRLSIHSIFAFLAILDLYFEYELQTNFMIRNMFLLSIQTRQIALDPSLSSQRKVKLQG